MSCTLSIGQPLSLEAAANKLLHCAQCASPSRSWCNPLQQLSAASAPVIVCQVSSSKPTAICKPTAASLCNVSAVGSPVTVCPVSRCNKLLTKSQLQARLGSVRADGSPVTVCPESRCNKLLTNSQSQANCQAHCSQPLKCQRCQRCRLTCRSVSSVL
jgi:hypothetical protein